MQTDPHHGQPVLSPAPAKLASSENALGLLQALPPLLASFARKQLLHQEMLRSVLRSILPMRRRPKSVVPSAVEIPLPQSPPSTSLSPLEELPHDTHPHDAPQAESASPPEHLRSHRRNPARDLRAEIAEHTVANPLLPSPEMSQSVSKNAPRMPVIEEVDENAVHEPVVPSTIEPMSVTTSPLVKRRGGMTALTSLAEEDEEDADDESSLGSSESESDSHQAQPMPALPREAETLDPYYQLLEKDNMRLRAEVVDLQAQVRALKEREGLSPTRPRKPPRSPTAPVSRMRPSHSTSSSTSSSDSDFAPRTPLPSTPSRRLPRLFAQSDDEKHNERDDFDEDDDDDMTVEKMMALREGAMGGRTSRLGHFVNANVEDAFVA